MPRHKMLSPLDGMLRPLINCVGVRAYAGNARLSDVTLTAMSDASKVFLLMDELISASGRRIANLMGAPDAIVTAGTCASLTLAAAASFSGNDPMRILELANRRSDHFRIAIPADQRFAYEHSFTLAGAEILPVSNAVQLERIAKEKSAVALCILGRFQAHSILPLSLAGQLCKGRIPIMVDAASGFPTNPDPWLSAGADLVAYSLGKFVGGPPAAGVLAGRPDLIAAVRILSAPHQAFGRGFKIGKEQIAGAVSALEQWFHDDIGRKLIKRSSQAIALLARRLSSIENVEFNICSRPGDTISRAELSWQYGAFGFDAVDLRARLMDTEPRVLVDDIDRPDPTIVIDPACLTVDEARIVADKLLGEFAKPASPKTTTAPDLNGKWTFEVDYSTGTESGVLDLWSTSSGIIHGICRFKNRSMKVAGRLRDDAIIIRCSTPIDNQFLFFEFAGVHSRETMDGHVAAGAARGEHNSAVFRTQLGRASWHASISRAEVQEEKANVNVERTSI